MFSIRLGRQRSRRLHSVRRWRRDAGSHRLRLECLEDRFAPAVYTWDGGAAMGLDPSWSAAENWSFNQAPPMNFGGQDQVSPLHCCDDLVFPAGAAQTIAIADYVNAQVFNSITFTGSDYLLSGFGFGLDNVDETSLDAGNITNRSAGTNSLIFEIVIVGNRDFVAEAGTLSIGGSVHPWRGSTPAEIQGVANELTLHAASGATVDVGASIGGEITIFKTGPGTAVLWGANAHTSPTTVDAGTLRIDGQQPLSTVNVSPNGTLGGCGVTGSIVVTDGTLSPACLTSAGDVTMNGGAFTVEIGLTPEDSGYGYLDVVGAVNLNGPDLILTSDTDAVADEYTIIYNEGDDPVSGQFSGEDTITVTYEDADGTILSAEFAISYAGGDGNDVVLTRIFSGGAPGSASSAIISASNPTPEPPAPVNTTPEPDEDAVVVPPATSAGEVSGGVSGDSSLVVSDSPDEGDTVLPSTGL